MKDIVATIVAIVALTALGIGAWIASYYVQVAETEWLRRMHLLGIAEAIGFAGAGWLWGREVHRAQAEHATGELKTERDRTEKANSKAISEADKAAKAKANFDALKAAIDTKRQQWDPRDNQGLGGADAAVLAARDLTDLSNLASQLQSR